jgi:tripartite-type tricarboxylate transporter receptor subunit TctC
MKLPRRRFLNLAAGAAALPAFFRTASALDYPARPVHWIVGFPPGGPNDITARIMADYLSSKTGPARPALSPPKRSRSPCPTATPSWS